jgi:hypothetical protein
MEFEDKLNRMTREELIALNRAIVKRIKMIDEFNRLRASADLYPGDRVSWKDKYGYPHTGRILRINSKTISVEEDNEPELIWRITATALQKID